VCAQPGTRLLFLRLRQLQFQDQALLALVGHPLVFWEDSPTTRVDIVKGEPALMVRQVKPGWLAISLVPEVPAKGKNHCPGEGNPHPPQGGGAECQPPPHC
jgi:hypothetical protein